MSYQGTVSYGASVVVVAVLCWSLRSPSWRKALSAITVAGAITGVPVVIGLRGHFNNVLTYQPRYMLPLFAVFLLMLLAPSPARANDEGRRVGSEEFRLPTSIAGRVGTGLVAATWALTNARALYLVIERYAFGRSQHGYPIDLSTRNLSVGNEWWWPTAPIGPMARMDPWRSRWRACDWPGRFPVATLPRKGARASSIDTSHPNRSQIHLTVLCSNM